MTHPFKKSTIHDTKKKSGGSLTGPAAGSSLPASGSFTFEVRTVCRHKVAVGQIRVSDLHRIGREHWQIQCGRNRDVEISVAVHELVDVRIVQVHIHGLEYPGITDFIHLHLDPTLIEVRGARNVDALSGDVYMLVHISAEHGIVADVHVRPDWHFSEKCRETFVSNEDCERGIAAKFGIGHVKNVLLI